MPRKPQPPCRYPGCGRLSDGPYCEEHRKAVRDEYNRYRRPVDSNKKYGRAWKRIRDRYTATHPLCEMCLKEGRLTPVEEVHHLVLLSQSGTHRNGERRTRRTETAVQGDAGVSGTAIHRGHGV